MMNYEKLSASLALALDDYQEQGRAALAPHTRLLGLVTAEEETPKPPRIVMFLHCDENTPADEWAELGVELNQGEGNVRTGIVPLDALDALTESEAVQRVVPARKLKPLMDVAAPKVGIPQLRSSGLSGKNVVVGVVDTGIDAKNPAFTGRIRSIWDQTLPGPGVAEGNYGAEFAGPMLTVSQDKHGHGTHVAGMAAGNDPKYTGVAPEATIVMVKSDLMTAHIADGIRYIFRVAEDMGLPAVANLSLGGHGDAHDGTDSLSAIIDAVSGPGRIVCCAAGNEGNDNIHAQADVNQGSYRSFSCVLAIGQQGQPAPTSTFNGWYDGGQEMLVSVVPPSGASTPYQAVIRTGSPIRSYNTPDGVCRVMTPGPDPANGDFNFFVQITPNSPPNTPNPQSWKIRVRGKQVTNGRVDLWTIDETTAQFTGGYVKDTMKIGSPGCSTSSVTVASYTTKTEWTDITGGQRESAEELDDISSFSSEGPRRDGARKPDVAAPGSVIVCSMSSHAPVSPRVQVDQWNRIMQGTSMACPFISGVVALLLERDPQLDPDGVKDLLKQASSIPNKQPGTWHRKWGYGLLDANDL